MNTGICGIGGRMGTAILNILVERGHRLGAAFDASGSEFLSRNASSLVDNSLADCIINEINAGDMNKIQGLIDFSGPGATMKLIDYALELNIPLVIGTTGFDEVQLSKIKEASQSIPVLLSPNMSLGVNLFFKLTKLAAAALSIDYDVEIFEAHHRFKKDAPSGTAKKLLDIVKQNMDGLSDAKDVNGRGGITGERTSNEIGMHAMRGGNIIGEHTVFFTGLEDRIELTHRAGSRDIFARGAVVALEFLSKQSAGFYSMYDVLGI